MNNRDLLFIDTETTGLDCAKHEIIEIAWILTSPDSRLVKEKYLARMLPLNIAAAEPKALEINGYKEEAWLASNPRTQDEVAKALWKVSQRAILVGQNVGFDEGFLKVLLAQNGLVPAWGYQKVDTIALAWPYYSMGKLGGLSLDKLCTFLGITQERKHSADADVESCYRVYQAFMAKYKELDLAPQLPKDAEQIPLL